MAWRRKVATLTALVGFALLLVSGNLDRIISRQAYFQFSIFFALAAISLIFVSVAIATTEKR